MKYLDLTLKNPSEMNISRIVLADFLEDKIIDLFQDQNKLHQKDLANLFCQKVRFQKEFLWATVSILIRKGIIIRQPRSSYLILTKRGSEL